MADLQIHLSSSLTVIKNSNYFSLIQTHILCSSRWVSLVEESIIQTSCIFGKEKYALCPQVLISRYSWDLFKTHQKIPTGIIFEVPNRFKLTNMRRGDAPVWPNPMGFKGRHFEPHGRPGARLGAIRGRASACCCWSIQVTNVRKKSFHFHRFTFITFHLLFIGNLA